MINIRTLRKLQDNDGLTLKNGKPIVYKTGYQVATEGVETTDIQVAIQLVREYKGNCGIWYANGVFAIDHSFRVNTKKEAIKIGKQCHQTCVLQWNTMKLIYC